MNVQARRSPRAEIILFYPGQLVLTPSGRRASVVSFSRDGREVLVQWEDREEAWFRASRVKVVLDIRGRQ